MFSTDSDDGIALGGLRNGIAKLASFVGCDMAFTVRKGQGMNPVSPYARVKCYRPLLLEGIILCLLSEVRERSATGAAVCRLEAPSETRDGMSLTLRYPLRTHEKPETAQMYERMHGRLEIVGETGGLDLYVPTQLLPSRDPNGLPEVAVTLDWLLDPSALSSSDIKARLSLVRTEGDGAEKEGEAESLAVAEEPFEADSV